MSKAKFTYDESGATFYYFILSFLALILVPSTYYLWPNEINQEEEKKEHCRCNGCKAKKTYLDNHYKWRRSRKQVTKFLIIAGWALFAAVAYKCSVQQIEYVNWDPFEILGLSENATPDEIKKAYRALSLKYHPDKSTGDPDKFVKISKAYAALTDEESRKNWEQYGNPDGPGATSFGIALPSWIVEKENSVLVLGVYILIFMIILPVSVGAWWYSSVKYGCDKVLIITTELYYHFIYKTPNMPIKRAIMILASSLEFAKSHNREIIERPEDNIEVPKLMREFTMLGEKNKEKPLCFSFSMKARTIIFAHLSRIKLPPNTLEVDRCMIVRKCPYLIHDFVSCTSQLITLAMSGRMNNKPTLLTLENGMKLCPMIVQALWEYQSPLLQLPHFTDDTLRQLERKKIKVRTIDQLARMSEQERRDSLRIFSDAQYEDIKFIISTMPVVSVDCKFEVLDDEEPDIITAGSIVTVSVKLRRKTYGDIMKGKITLPEVVEEEPLIETPPEEAEDYQTSELDVSEQEPTDKENVDFEEDLNIADNGTKINNNDNNINNNYNDDVNSQKTNNKRNKNKKNNNKSNGSKADKKTKAGPRPESGKVAQDSDAEKDLDSDAEDDWDRKFREKVIKKQKVFEAKPVISHPVHCPYYPDDKQEFWWVYLVDRKRVSLVTAPVMVTSLVDTEDLELKFTAPLKPGSYNFTIVVRSDSYLDAVIQKQANIDVKPMREFIEPINDIPDDESDEELDEESGAEDSDLLTDSDN